MHQPIILHKLDFKLIGERVTGWVVWSPNPDEGMLLWTLSINKSIAIQKFLKGCGVETEWKKRLQKGFMVVEVQVECIGQDNPKLAYFDKRWSTEDA